MRTNLVNRTVLAAVIFTVAFAVFFAFPAHAQEMSADATDAIVEDALLAETDAYVADSNPEWYQAPVIPARQRAPYLAKAKSCPVDSVCTYDENEILVGVSAYDYDERDSVVRATVWKYENGLRIGISRREYGYDASGRQNMSATYEWISSANNWRGTEKAEFVYDDEDRITSNTQYTWINNAWVADKRYTYVFDAQGREKEFTTYTRNTTSNQLVYSKCRIQDWDEVDRQILDIQYTAYSGGMWSAGTKKEWKYDGDGNKTEYAYYSSISNGSWVGSSKEEWEYTSGKKTLYAKYSWSNGAWVGVSKEIWGFESGKDKLYEKYTWNSAWVCVERKEWTYNTSGKKTLYEYKKLEGGAWVLYEQETCAYDGSYQTSYEKYARMNGVWVGVKKETWVYTSGKKTKHNTYIWANSNWTDSEEELWVYTSGKETNYEKWAWENSAKIGKEKRTSEYTSGKLTLQQKFSWANGAWAIAEKEVWEYTSGKQTLHEKYTAENGALIGVEKETWEYASNVLKFHEKFAWLNSAWAAVLRESYDSAGRQTLIEEYTISSTNTLTGSKKEEYEFSATGKKILQKIYKWNKSKKLWGTCAVTGFDEAGNTIESCGYTWLNDAWEGSSERVLTTFDSDKRKIDEITQEWNSGGWLNSFRHTYTYSGRQILKEATFNWVNGAWADSRRTEYHYTAAGQNDSINVYKKSGSEWIYDKRTVNTFDAKGNKILTYVASFVNGKWTLKSMEKLEILFDNANRQILYATWECGPDSIWKGKEKDTTSYSATDKILFRAQYKGWANNKWVGVMLVENRYDAADRVIYEKRLDWDSYLNAWKGNYENEYGYDEQGRQIMKAKYSSWDKSTSSWSDGDKEENEYDENGKLLTQITSTWTGARWRLMFKYAYTYDNAGREIAKTVEHYENNAWEYQNRYEKEYKGSTLVKSNAYLMLNGNWVFASRYELYFDSDAQAKLRRQIEGSWNNGELLSFADDNYFYSCDSHAFTINFVNEDGTILTSESVQEGQVPTYTGATPTKSADAQYTYIFAGWDKEIVAVTGATTYTATFNATLRKYTITFANEDGSTIEAKEYEYGATPIAPSDPTKPATAQYTYTFAGWDKTIVTVTGEATYKATFTSTVNKYTITFVNEDGTTIEAKEYEYGATPVAPSDPTKPATAQYTYTFAGWDKTIAAVTGVATYKATFTATTRTYTITWVDGDGKTIKTEQVAYGETPVYTGETPTKTASGEQTYEFNYSWSPAIVPVTGDATYTALFIETGVHPSTVIITYVDDEGNVLFYEMYNYGQTPEPATPGKPSTAQYDYTFTGWSPAIAPATSDVTYTATYSAIVRSYTITFVNDNGKVLYSEVLEYGQMPEYVGDTPTKAEDQYYTYTFSGWTPEIGTVVGKTTYTATYTATQKVNTGIADTGSDAPATKVIENGILYIIRAGQKYTTTGAPVR